MRSESKKSAAGKIASFSIVVLVLVGAAAIMGVSEVSEKSILSKAFVFFVGAVIVVQVVPGLMLFGAMLKAVCSMAGKKVAAPVAAGK
jgi:uncharacterized membrane protein YjjB (DUF3815 family)